MRQIAAEMGVSPMTPYRYFRDKDEILALVRAAAFNQFAENLERAVRAAGTPAPRRGRRALPTWTSRVASRTPTSSCRAYPGRRGPLPGAGQGPCPGQREHGRLCAGNDRRRLGARRRQADRLHVLGRHPRHRGAGAKRRPGAGHGRGFPAPDHHAHPVRRHGRVAALLGRGRSRLKSRSGGWPESPAR
ncbi:TetR/AcrR family transcriptional regulator [Alcanivorax sp. IO_7]|nr:TetR/AcrR family transcriptional regulator [Alcanivorax sp. IO_7]